jgi:hypothetical protein
MEHSSKHSRHRILGESFNRFFVLSYDAGILGTGIIMSTVVGAVARTGRDWDVSASSIDLGSTGCAETALIAFYVVGFVTSGVAPTSWFLTGSDMIGIAHGFSSYQLVPTPPAEI